ncbi:hypothetical protein [Actinomadura fibrosa]|uniref:Uncharacterized protein n=1 Tax=Actinomadura fibrosa TaxID=111802 RepID=A0ABW2Y4T7_9ACTN|nr:hypothetical protein [Actinomadura fibrosa]
MKRRSLLFWFGVFVGVAVFAAAGTVAYALLSTSDGPLAESNGDSRAVKGSDPRISLERAASDLRLRLPASMSEVRYLARNDSSPYFLDVSFVIPCSDVQEFTADNGLARGRSAKVDSIELEQLRKVARDLGRPMPADRPATVWTSGDGGDASQRAVADAPLRPQACQVVGTFEDYS